VGEGALGTLAGSILGGVVHDPLVQAHAAVLQAWLVAGFAPVQNESATAVPSFRRQVTVRF
jgi:hypothetical protein